MLLLQALLTLAACASFAGMGLCILIGAMVFAALTRRSSFTTHAADVASVGRVAS